MRLEREHAEPESRGDWVVGRAGMHYRDLVPNRLGGALVASHIRIPDGGPVPDEVHYHELDAQLIYCLSGSVQLVYEDQGPPFEMRAGDVALQPPGIRHRVLECSPGFAVVELAAPADHDTRFDHELALPTNELRPERRFSDQRFHFRRAESRESAREDLGLAEPSGGRVEAFVTRLEPDASLAAHPERARFVFVLAGEVELTDGAGGPRRLEEAEAHVLLPNGTGRLRGSGARVLDVLLPAAG